MTVAIVAIIPTVGMLSLLETRRSAQEKWFDGSATIPSAESREMWSQW